LRSSSIAHDIKNIVQNDDDEFQWNIPLVALLGQHVHQPGHGDPLQQPQGAGVAGRQHLHHHRPRREQAADGDAARHPQPAGRRQPHQPAETRRGPAQTGSVPGGRCGRVQTTKGLELTLVDFMRRPWITP